MSRPFEQRLLWPFDYFDGEPKYLPVGRPAQPVLPLPVDMLMALAPFLPRRANIAEVCSLPSLIHFHRVGVDKRQYWRHNAREILLSPPSASVLAGSRQAAQSARPQWQQAPAGAK